MFIFPAHIFNPEVVHARIVQNTISGGVALSGDEDVIATDGGGRWIISYSGIYLDTPFLLRAWEAWLHHLAGGTNECLVPLLSIETAPRAFQWDQPAQVSSLRSDNEVFPTSVAYSVPQIIASVTAQADLRATSVSIAISKGSRLKGGEKFSVGGRAYRVGQNTGGDTWGISPPVREPIVVGASANFEWPVLKCRMRPGEDFSSPIGFGETADAQISFVEAL